MAEDGANVYCHEKENFYPEEVQRWK